MSKIIKNHLLLLLKKFPDWGWNIDELSQNPNITQQDVDDLTHIDWDINWFSKNTNLGNELNRPYLGRDMYNVSHIPNITSQYPNNLTHINWNMCGDSKNSNINLQDMLNIPHLEWNMGDNSKDPNITLQDVLEHPHPKWDNDCISQIESLTFDDIVNNPELNWDVVILSKNPFNRNNAALRIQKAWKQYKKRDQIKKEMREESSYFNLFDNNLIDKVVGYF